jgi:hypothetical protein
MCLKKKPHAKKSKQKQIRKRRDHEEVRALDLEVAHDRTAEDAISERDRIRQEAEVVQVDLVLVQVTNPNLDRVRAHIHDLQRVHELVRDLVLVLDQNRL